MDDVRELHALQRDALREVANIGAGHAATALSQLTNRRIMISVPEVNIVRLEEVPDILGKPDDVVAAVLMHMMGDLTGRTLVLFPEECAGTVCDILLRRPLGTTSAYLNALSDFMGMMLVPSVPSLAIDQAGAVLTSIYMNFGYDRDYVFCVETRFLFEDPNLKLRGHFLLLPDLASLRAIFDAIRLP
jgi:chemotaxis protein CheC